MPQLKAKGIDPYVVILDGENSQTPPAFFESDVLFYNVPPQRRLPNVQARVQDQMRRMLAKATSAGVQWIIFASSTSVYANLNRVVTEADARTGIPARESGQALRLAEEMLRQASVDATILRYAGLYGPNRFPGRFMAGKKGVAGATSPVNLVHQADAVRVVVRLLAQNKRGGAYNICADEHPTRAHLYVAAARTLGLEPPSFSAEPQAYKVISNQRLKKHLGYSFLHPDPLRDVQIL